MRIKPEDFTKYRKLHFFVGASQMVDLGVNMEYIRVRCCWKSQNNIRYLDVESDSEFSRKLERYKPAWRSSQQSKSRTYAVFESAEVMQVTNHEVPFQLCFGCLETETSGLE
jgi:hypothetical protein